MRITTIRGESISQIEISEDVELENFIALCQMEHIDLSSVPIEDIRLIYGGIVLVPTSDNMKKQIKDLGIKDGDVINLDATAAYSINQNRSVMAPNLRQAPSSASTSGGQTANMGGANLISALVNNIKVPTKRQISKPSAEGLEKIARSYFDALTEEHRLKSTVRLDYLRVEAEELAIAFEKNPSNFDHFLAAFKQHWDGQRRKAKLVHDPNSIEGQRYIAEQIERSNIDFSHEFAMEHMPEAFIPVHMLFIKMRINNYPIIAFVDSGAQVSILSEECAQRCNVDRLIDKRIRATAVGVGGTQKFVGRIHSCEVKIKDHTFACPFDVMADRNMDLLLGLNTLLRHKCSIDLQKMVLRFGDGTEAEFLTEQELEREKMALEMDRLSKGMK